MKIDRTVIDPKAPEAGDGKTQVDPIKLAPGLRIEQYELIRELGRGGMGQVFLARDNRLGRRVAMKFLSSGSRKHTERFLVEARATARCSHENIVVIHDVDQYLGKPYMVLEYVEGTTLGKLMAERRLPVGRTIELIVPVVRALARAHEANIVHRDLKPENIIVTATGTVKVLDFGIAKLASQPIGEKTGAIIGTLPYMSPEQLGTDEIDHRSDLWAVGIILFEMLAGKHPLEPVTQGTLFASAAAVDEPMPSIGNEVPGLPDRLVQVIDRCLAKPKTARYATAQELCDELEPLLPGRGGRNLVGDESPYPGLKAFQESDANRFFGRLPDIAELVTRLRDQPLVGVVGASGVGKSSFVRAGVVPALKASGEPWEILIVRPGRHPLQALASTLDSLRDSRDSDPVLGDDAVSRLRDEPGTLGARLRARARRKRSQILLFVDQHEELYTLVPDPAERRAFTACLAGAADDASGPLRVVVSMRSDFLDRAAEDRRFVDELTRGLVFLQPPSRGGLEEALVSPLVTLGYGFEPGIVRDMLEALEATPGSLPLLQFTAAKLWETRDKSRRVLTRDSYYAMGGVGGALASHADEVLAGFSAPDQRLVRSLFLRLVTPERTRAIVEVGELRDLGADVERIVAHLVESRLLVVHARGDGEGATAVELVHESLIKSWPKLQRWLDESAEDASFLAQLRGAAKQWHDKGRVDGLLWRDEAMQEARLWRARYPHRELAPREQDYLDAVFAHASRAARRRRALVAGAFAVLLVVIAGGAVALVKIRSAEHAAVDAEQAAIAEKQKAQDNERAARDAQAAEQRKAAELNDTLVKLVATQQAEKQAIAERETAEVARQQAQTDAQKKAAAAKLSAARAHEAEAKRQAQIAKQKADDERRRKARGDITTDLK
ncbi:MAG: protein kinase domain-containing protein [Acidobacteriota bacterium]